MVWLHQQETNGSTKGHTQKGGTGSAHLLFENSIVEHDSKRCEPDMVVGRIDRLHIPKRHLVGPKIRDDPRHGERIAIGPT